jgi:hypothetical protein
MKDHMHHAVVLDLSAQGLFLGMAADARKEIERCQLTLQPERGEQIELVVDIVRQLLVPLPLLTMARGGVGVRIVSAPDAYYDLLSEMGIPDHHPPSPSKKRRKAGS